MGVLFVLCRTGREKSRPWDTLAQHRKRYFNVSIYVKSSCRTVFDRCLPWLNFNNYILYLLLKSGGEGFIGMGRSDSSSCPSVTYVRNTWRHSYLNRISSCTKYSKFKWNFHNVLGHQTDLSHSGNKLQLVCVRRCAWTVDSFWKKY